MFDNLFIAALVADFLFLASGAIELGYSIATIAAANRTPSNGKEATRHLLYEKFPFTAAIINAGFILAVFCFTIPGLALMKRKLLKITSYMIAFCGIFTLSIGLYLWIMTLRLKETFAPIYGQQEPAIQSLVQSMFECCGYFNSTSPAFVTDATCTSPAGAALLRGCSTYMSSYANSYINQLFTAVFGVVGVDTLFLLAIACLLKDRKEKERFYMIDQKSGYNHL